MSFRRQGRMVAAITVPRNVTAMTRAASRMKVWKLKTFHAYRALTTIDGTTIRTSAPYGTRRPAEMFAAQDGSTRSNAAAKMTRVDDRNRVPAQPKNQAPITSSSTTWKRWLFTNQPANMIGLGQIVTGAVPAPNALLAEL